MPNTMPKNPNWRKKKDEPATQDIAIAPLHEDFIHGPSRQVRRRAMRKLDAVPIGATSGVTLLSGGEPLVEAVDFIFTRKGVLTLRDVDYLEVSQEVAAA